MLRLLRNSLNLFLIITGFSKYFKKTRLQSLKLAHSEDYIKVLIELGFRQGY